MYKIKTYSLNFRIIAMSGAQVLVYSTVNLNEVYQFIIMGSVVLILASWD